MDGIHYRVELDSRGFGDRCADESSLRPADPIRITELIQDGVTLIRDQAWGTGCWNARMRIVRVSDNVIIQEEVTALNPYDRPNPLLP